MKCPYCAEDIQPDAIVCRFCGAVKNEGQWSRPQTGSDRSVPDDVKPNQTIRIAGAFFVISALLELASLQTAVPFLGEMRGGMMATGYHLMYLGLFLAMGIGLWIASSWGYRLMFVGTLIYSLDKFRYLVDDRARELELAMHLKSYGDLLGPSEQAFILQTMDLVAIISVLCWWGFLAYLYSKRKLFRPRQG